MVIARHLSPSVLETQEVKGSRELNNTTTSLPPTIPLDFHLINIPMTGGRSVVLDSPGHLWQGQTLHANHQRMSFPFIRDTYLTSNNRSMAFVLLRSPMNHIISQYKECKFGAHNETINFISAATSEVITSETEVAPDFNEWVAHFVSQANVYNPSDTSSDLCGEPWNTMARYFTLEDPLTIPSYSSEPSQRFPLLSKAKDNMQDPKLIVGITEYYSASLCLLEYHASQGNLNEACRTCDRALHQSSIDALAAMDTISNQTTVQNIKILTAVDQELYHFALELFYEEIDNVEALTGIDLLCRPREPIDIAARTITQPLFFWMVGSMFFSMVLAQLIRRQESRYLYKTVSTVDQCV